MVVRGWQLNIISRNKNLYKSSGRLGYLPNALPMQMLSTYTIQYSLIENSKVDTDATSTKLHGSGLLWEQYNLSQ